MVVDEALGNAVLLRNSNAVQIELSGNNRIGACAETSARTGATIPCRGANCVRVWTRRDSAMVRTEWSDFYRTQSRGPTR